MLQSGEVRIGRKPESNIFFLDLVQTPSHYYNLLLTSNLDCFLSQVC